MPCFESNHIASLKNNPFDLDCSIRIARVTGHSFGLRETSMDTSVTPEPPVNNKQVSKGADNSSPTGNYASQERNETSLKLPLLASR